MKRLNSLEELKIPYTYKAFIRYFLSNVTNISSVERVIIFGSCAREEVDEQKSDIDLLILTDDNISLDEEFYIMSGCAPAYGNEHYIPSDIIINSVRHYNRFKNRFGMVQQQIELEGIDLTELL